MRAGAGFPKKLLREAEVDEDTTRDIVFRGADAYDDSIPLARAMRDDVMLAFLMNGEKLPKEHGFPLRLLVPGLYGIKNVEWIGKSGVCRGLQRLLAAQRMDGRCHDQDILPHRFARPIKLCAAPNNDSAASPSADRIPSAEWKSAWMQQEPGTPCEIETPMSPYSWVI